VHGFREFCKNVVGAVKGPVVIAIDELDKVESTNDVIELLRAIKGIFDIRGVHYFVSVSDEAARRLQLSGIRERDEFNSSFYQVFELPRAGMEIIDAIIEKRGIKRLAENEAAAVEVFCSGIPREAIRLIDILRNELDDDMMGFDDWPIWSILNAEVAAFQKDVQSAKDGRILDSDRRIVGQPLEVRLTPGAGPAEIYELWDMSDTSEGFRTRYSKDFRRLLNRVAVGQILRRRPPKLYIEVLEEAIMANERDPSLGRLAIDRCMSQLGIAYSPSPLSPAQHEQT